MGHSVQDGVVDHSMLCAGSLPTGPWHRPPRFGLSRRGGHLILKPRRLSVAIATLSRVAGTTGRARVFTRPQILNLALRNEPGSQALREVSERRPCVCSLHVQEHGEVDVSNQGKAFTHQGKDDARRS